MRINDEQEKRTLQGELLEWRALHPELSDEAFDEAMRELRIYLPIAWQAFRESHPELQLPESF